MVFLAPLMLFGALAAAVPIAIHFFFRSRYRTVPWAAMQFLLTSLEQTSRRLKFQELLLLLARIAVLVLLAVALARPASWKSFAGAGAGDAVDAVFVIDTSYSMAVREADGQTRLDHARTAAKAILDNLPGGSTVQVVAVSDRAVELPEKGLRTPGDFGQVRNVLDRIEVTHLSTDFRPGFELAGQLLENAENPNKAIYLFSDMQGAGFQRQDRDLADAVKALSAKSAIYLVRCGSRSPTNVSVVGVTPAGGGLLHTGERTPFAVLLRNSGKQEVRGLTVRLEVDGQKEEGGSAAVLNEQRQQVLGPGETRAVTVTARFTQPGLSIVTATVSGDDLDVDNRLDRVVQVHDKVRVLVVDGKPDKRDPDKAASYYLGHALLTAPESLWGSYHIQPRVVPADDAHPRHLDGVDLCVLTNAPLREGGGDAGLSPEFVARLAERVHEGLALMVFAGDRVGADAYNRVLLEQHQLLPAKLTKPYDAAARDDPFLIDPSTAASFLSRFQDKPLVLIGLVEVQRALGVVEPAADSLDAGRVLLRYTPVQNEKTGRPAVLTRKVGEGTVMLVTTSPDTSWTAWPKAPEGIFLAFVRESLQGLLPGRAEGLNRVVGEPLTWHPPAGDVGKPAHLITPKGDAVRLPAVQLVQGQATLAVPETRLTGIYRIVLGEKPNDDKAPSVLFAVGLEPLPGDATRLRESENLEGMDEAEINALLGVPVTHLNAGVDPGGFVTAERFNKDWTFWVLAAVLGLVLFEAALAWFCGRPIAT